jgi:hypothetical protein
MHRVYASSRLDRITNGCLGRLEKKMAVSEDDVRQVFRGLENGNRGKFFDHVADNVDWIVEGAHSLVAHYRSKGAALRTGSCMWVRSSSWNMPW